MVTPLPTIDVAGAAAVSVASTKNVLIGFEPLRSYRRIRAKTSLPLVKELDIHGTVRIVSMTLARLHRVFYGVAGLALLVRVVTAADGDIPKKFAEPTSEFDFLKREVMIPMRDG